MCSVYCGRFNGRDIKENRKTRTAHMLAALGAFGFADAVFILFLLLFRRMNDIVVAIAIALMFT